MPVATRAQMIKRAAAPAAAGTSSAEESAPTKRQKRVLKDLKAKIENEQRQTNKMALQRSLGCVSPSGTPAPSSVGSTAASWSSSLAPGVVCVDSGTESMTEAESAAQGPSQRDTSTYTFDDLSKGIAHRQQSFADIPCGQQSPASPAPGTGEGDMASQAERLSAAQTAMAAAAAAPGESKGEDDFSKTDLFGGIDESAIGVAYENLALSGPLDEASTADVDKLLKEEAEKARVRNETMARMKSKVDENVAYLEEVARTGLFDIRDKVGQRFQRDHKPGSENHTKYSLLKSRQAKAEYRKSWSQAKFKNHVEGKEHEESYTVIDSEKGSYKTFGALVVHYGGWGWPPAIKGAYMHAAKAARMGGQWSYVDGWSGLQHFFLLERRWEGIMSEKWSLFQKQITEVADKTELADDAANSGAATPQGKSKAKAKAKAKALAGGEGDGGKQPKKPHEGGGPDDTADNLKEACRLKGLMAKYKLAGETLSAKIKTDADYKWARNGENMGLLDKALEALDLSLGDFGKEFLVHDHRQVKKWSSSPSKFDLDIIKFNQTRLLIENIKKQTDTIINMHKLRMEAADGEA